MGLRWPGPFMESLTPAGLDRWCGTCEMRCIFKEKEQCFKL